MKSALIIALAILKLTVEGVPSASAETRLEQLLEFIASEQSQENVLPQPVNKTPAKALENTQQQPSLFGEITSEKTQLSERDRLIQERFLIKIISAENQ